MPLFSASRRDGGGRHRAPSVRERLQLIVSVLGELEYLRHRQELLVLSALREERSAAQPNCEENLLVLRRQLSCLKRDAGVISDLHELDQQINDLRLDAETSHDPLEMDSRPSSGFYELSDGTSNSLSNSSHSVFSECFCSPDERSSCLESDVLIGGLCDDSGCRSLSAPLQAPLDATYVVPTDSPAKTFCSLFSRNVPDVYGHKSPLRSSAFQASGSLQVSGNRGQSLDEACAGCLQTETSPAPSPASGSQCAASQTPSNKQLENYIFGLLQRRAQPIRTGRPRTSIARQHSLCLRPVSGPSSSVATLKGPEVKPRLPPGETSTEVVTISTSQRQCSAESKDKEKSSLRVYPDGEDIMQISSNSNPPAGPDRCVTSRVKSSRDKKDLSKVCRELTGSSVQNCRDQKSLKLNSFDSETCCPPDQEELLQPALTSKPHTGSSKKSFKFLQSRGPSENSMELLLSTSELFAQNMEEGVRVLRRSHVSNGIPAKQHLGKHRHGNDRKVPKVKSTCRSNTIPASDLKKLPSEKRGDYLQHNSSHGRSHPAEDVSSNQPNVSTSSERRVPDKHARSVRAAVRSGGVRTYHPHHHHGREQVIVAKPKYKRRVFQLPRTIVETPYDGGHKHIPCRLRKKLPRKPAVKTCATSRVQQNSSYATIAKSDSEYSAECVSLFHSTIVDSSEDDRSNYTTNCFGDSESSEEEDEEEKSTTDTEVSVGGGPGRCKRRGQLRTARVTVGKLETDPAQTKAPVKIKASYNLKRKILRFRSGSLKLMTTV